jgi:uncharacterized protein with GYD domain
MANYVILVRWTEQGIKDVKDTLQRAQQFRNDCERRGIRVTGLYWTEGRYDLAITLEAPDEQTMMAEVLGLCSLGNVHTETLRAFTESEMGAILRKI